MGLGGWWDSTVIATCSVPLGLALQYISFKKKKKTFSHQRPKASWKGAGIHKQS
jgi:hypothetical protein